MRLDLIKPLGFAVGLLWSAYPAGAQALTPHEALAVMFAKLRTKFDPKLLQIFEVIGLEDPWVASTRRRLSTVLFG